MRGLSLINFCDESPQVFHYLTSAVLDKTRIRDAYFFVPFRFLSFYFYFDQGFAETFEESYMRQR